MDDFRLTKRESRQRTSELSALMCEWDPIGVMGDSDWPRDEYDCLVWPLLRLLEAGAGEAELAGFLRTEISEHFGLSPEHYDFPSVAHRVRAWFDHAWRIVVAPETVFVGLLGEGTSVWRPVQARPLGSGLFRIVGVEGDVSDETWEFPVGAIVRCEKKRLSSDPACLVAIELASAAG
jgi:hypothetical protein